MCIGDVMIDCYGTVLQRTENSVRVGLMFRDGRIMERIFEGEQVHPFIEAGVAYADASFHYVMRERDGGVVSKITAEDFPENYLGVVDMPEIDLSVFE